jgi:hypothetical protein
MSNLNLARRLLRRAVEALDVPDLATAQNIAPMLNIVGDALGTAFVRCGWRVTLVAWPTRENAGKGSTAFAFGGVFPDEVEAQRVTAVAMLRFAADSLDNIAPAHERPKS